MLNVAPLSIKQGLKNCIIHVVQGVSIELCYFQMEVRNRGGGSRGLNPAPATGEPDPTGSNPVLGRLQGSFHRPDDIRQLRRRPILVLQTLDVERIDLSRFGLPLVHVDHGRVAVLLHAKSIQKGD